MIEKRSLLRAVAPAQTRMRGVVIAVTFVLTVVVIVASSFLVISAIGQSASGEVSVDQSVYVVPMNPDNQSTRRRSRELQVEDGGLEDWDDDYYGRGPPGQPTITWEETCPTSKLQCKSTAGVWVDVSGLIELSYLSGTGYDSAFGECSAGWSIVTPYSAFATGGIFARNFKHLVPRLRRPIENFMKSVNIDSFGELMNDGDYSTTCKDSNYFSEDEYTCGLQYIEMAAAYRGPMCHKLRDAQNEALSSIKIHADVWGDEDKDDEGYHFIFDNSANIDDELKQMRDECGWRMGKLPMFDALKQLLLLGKRDAFVKFEVDASIEKELNRDGATPPNPLLGRLQYFTQGHQLTVECKYDIVIAIGSPTCDAPVVVVENARFVGDDEYIGGKRSNYQLSKYGFEYNVDNDLWHRKGVDGCDKGCCDDCFQWYCPIYKTSTRGGVTKQVKRDGSAGLPYECTNYTYDCTRAGVADYDGSSAQVCGVETDDDRVRARCM